MKDEPDGLGSIAEEKVYAGNFFVPEERLKDKGQEKWLLMAIVEDLLRHEIALREKAYDGSYLVFPSQFTYEDSELLNPEGEAVLFGFEGPVQNIYVTLIVQLTHSGMFRMQKLWKNAVTYTTRTGGTYGIYLRNIREKQGELVLFFDKAASEESCYSFKEYVHTHLQHRAFANSIQRHTVFSCSGCGFKIPEQLIDLLAKRGFNWLNCPVPTCGTYISLANREERLNASLPLKAREMTPIANLQADREVAKSNTKRKKVSKDFDVFLCHNSEDKPAVRRLAKQLQEQGILPWLDEWELQPGLPWQRVLEDQIAHIKAAVVFVGKEGVGPWQQLELEAFLRQFVKRGCPVIPVLLPDAPREPQLPIFLESMTWVDFRTQDPDPMEHLIWGITGKRRKI